MCKVKKWGDKIILRKLCPNCGGSNEKNMH